MRDEVEGGLDARVVEVEGRGDDAVADGQDREDRLDRAGGAEEVADGGLGRGHRDALGRGAEQALDGLVDDMLTVSIASPNSRRTAPSSSSSPIGVEVPWALM